MNGKEINLENKKEPINKVLCATKIIGKFPKQETITTLVLSCLFTICVLTLSLCY